MDQIYWYDYDYTKLCKYLGINLNKGKTVTVIMPAEVPIKVTDETKDTEYEVN